MVKSKNFDAILQKKVTNAKKKELQNYFLLNKDKSVNEKKLIQFLSKFGINFSNSDDQDDYSLTPSTNNSVTNSENAEIVREELTKMLGADIDQNELVFTDDYEEEDEEDEEEDEEEEDEEDEEEDEEDDEEDEEDFDEEEEEYDEEEMKARFEQEENGDFIDYGDEDEEFEEEEECYYEDLEDDEENLFSE